MRYSVADTTRLAAALGFVPGTTIEAGLLLAREFYRNPTRA
ncbi:MAG: hypothetical protein QM784_28560 [Polyangiaceae bacterium]